MLFKATKITSLLVLIYLIGLFFSIFLPETFSNIYIGKTIDLGKEGFCLTDQCAHAALSDYIRSSIYGFDVFLIIVAIIILIRASIEKFFSKNNQKAREFLIKGSTLLILGVMIAGFIKITTVYYSVFFR